MTEFITGPSLTQLSGDEVLTAVECDALPGYGGSFEKVGQRRSLVISIVCLAVLVKLDAQGREVDDVRLAIGGIGPMPIRLTEVENFLRGGSAGDFAKAAGLDQLPWSKPTKQWRDRVMFVRAAEGASLDNPWPDLSDDGLKAQRAAWLVPSRSAQLPRALRGLIRAPPAIDQADLPLNGRWMGESDIASGMDPDPCTRR